MVTPVFLQIDLSGMNVEFIKVFKTSIPVALVNVFVGPFKGLFGCAQTRLIMVEKQINSLMLLYNFSTLFKESQGI